MVNRMAPPESIHELLLQDSRNRWETRLKVAEAVMAFEEATPPPHWETATEEEERAYETLLANAETDAESKWDPGYYRDLLNLQAERRNRAARRHRLLWLFSCVSPLSSVRTFAMDLARTGHVQQEQIEGALSAYLPRLAAYVTSKKRAEGGAIFGGVNLKDIPVFEYRDREDLREPLARNLLPIINLVLFVAVGFWAAYIAIRKYDVR